MSHLLFRNKIGHDLVVFDCHYHTIGFLHYFFLAKFLYTTFAILYNLI